MSRIIVKNLPNGIKEERLRQLFGECGTITDCSLKFTKDGFFRKFAFIGFQKPAEAENAVQQFNQTFVNMTKIQVAMANDLTDSGKNRPWSKHSKAVNKTPSHLAANEMDKAEKKKKYESDVLKQLEQKVEFQEFLEVHKSRSNKSSWVNDIVLPKADVPEKTKNLNRAAENESSNEDDDYKEKMADTTVVDKSEVKKPKQKLSDLEYLKSKMTSDFALSDDESVSEDESLSEARNVSASHHQAGETLPAKYLVKMKGLSTSVKRAQLEEFFKPLVPVNIHIPKKKHKALCVVTVEFSSEKDQEQAMRRNRNYIGTKKVFLHKIHEAIRETAEEEKPCKWTFKAKIVEEEIAPISESGRLFVRNLPYCCMEEDLKAAFEKYGSVEVNLPVDRITKKIKGFAIITYSPPENAIKALAELDGTIFQGRMLHILPAKKSKSTDIEITDDMPFKKKKELQQKANASSAHNWNALFVGASAVADVMAEKYSKSKDELLTQAGKKDSIGVRLALGETQIVAETRQFLIDNGVALDSFSQPAAIRSKTVILVKHLPAGTTAEEIRVLFDRYGTVGRVVLPPGGLTAIVEYIEATEARVGFRSLAYTKFKHIPLYLEWAPVDVFHTPASPAVEEQTSPLSTEVKESKEENATERNSEASESEVVDDDDAEPGSTIFVKNLNFITAEDKLKMMFEKVGKVRTVTVARKKDMKNPGQLLSMGYGFVEFKDPAAAKQAIKVLQHSTLDGHQLELKVSNRITLQSSSEQKSQKSSKKKQKNSTKIIIRNIPFEAKVSEVRQLFSVFGELKAVRIPKKLSGTGTHRGFGFVDFLTKEDAKRAFGALCHSTHLYGRRLVLEWADTDAETVEALRRKTAEHFVEDQPSGKKLKKSAILEELDTGKD